MKRLIFILFAIIGTAQAQTIQYIGAPTTTVISRGNFRTDSIFYLPKRTKLPTDTAALRYQISDSSLYAWTGSQWRKVGSDADTLVYSTRAWRQKGDDSLASLIALRVRISDTASMLTPYLRKADTTAMLSPYYRSATATAALVLKLNISDTSSMLTNYVRHAGYGLTKSGQSFIVDTAAMATRARVQKGIDSLQANINAKGNGTVTSVATGFGLSGGTITSTGTLIADSAALATRARVQKQIDSLAATEVSGSGTTNYVAKFTASGTVGNSSIFDNGEVLIATTTDAGDFKLQVSGNAYVSGNVGVGTTSPGAKLDVNGDIIATASNFTPLTIRRNNAAATAGIVQSFQLKNSADTYVDYAWIVGGITSPTSGSHSGFLSFNTASSATVTERMRITSAGDVGIGNTSPSYKLDISGTLRNTTSAYFATSSGEAYIGTTTDAGDYNLQVSGNIYSTGTAILSATSGNVGIGTTSPALENNASVVKEVTITKSGGTQNIAQLNLQGDRSNDTTANTRVGTISGWQTSTEVVRINFNRHAANNSGSIDFVTNNAGAGLNVRMRVGPSGEVLINSTVDQGDYNLQVTGNIYNTGSITTGAPSGGSIKPWKIGEAATVSPTSPNRTIRVEIDGTVYYLHAKTTND